MQASLVSPPAPDYLQYQYRPDLEVLVGRWLRQPSEEELQAGYYHLLDAAVNWGARLWLLDARRRTTANQQSTPWMVETFWPLLPSRLGSPAFIAYLFMPTHLAEIEHDASVPPLSYFNSRPYHVERFTDEHSAMKWLESCRQQQEVA